MKNCRNYHLLLTLGDDFPERGPEFEAARMGTIRTSRGSIFPHRGPAVRIAGTPLSSDPSLDLE